MASASVDRPLRAALLDKPSVAAVLAQLLEACAFAARTGKSTAAEPIELCCLLQAGGSAPALRWLVRSGLVDHLAGASNRVRRIGEPFRQNSRFRLRPEGARLARRRALASARPAEQGLTPQWNPWTLQLRFAGRLVKALTPSAGNQLPILDAFEECGWPARIADPLPVRPGGDVGKRLRNAIQRLNRQEEPLLRFRTDGAATGVRWTLTAAGRRLRLRSADGRPAPGGARARRAAPQRRPSASQKAFSELV